MTAVLREWQRSQIEAHEHRVEQAWITAALGRWSKKRRLPDLRKLLGRKNTSARLNPPAPVTDAEQAWIRQVEARGGEL